MAAVKRAAEQAGLTSCGEGGPLKKPCIAQPLVKIHLRASPEAIRNDVRARKQAVGLFVPESAPENAQFSLVPISTVWRKVAELNRLARPNPWTMMFADFSVGDPVQAVRLLPALGGLRALVIMNWTRKSAIGGGMSDMFRFPAVKNIPLLHLKDCAIAPRLFETLVKSSRPQRLKMTRFSSTDGLFWARIMEEHGYVITSGCAAATHHGHGDQPTVFKGEYVLAEVLEKEEALEAAKEAEETKSEEVDISTSGAEDSDTPESGREDDTDNESRD